MSDQPNLFDTSRRYEETLGYLDPATGEILPDTGGKLSFRSSVSLGKTFAECGAKGYARVSKQDGRKNVSSILGTAVHAAIESRVCHQSDMTPVFDRVFRDEIEKAELSFDDPKTQIKYNDGPALLASANAFLNSPFEGVRLIDKIDPKLSEYKIEFDYRGWQFVGFIDQIVRYENGSYFFIDYKTGLKAPSAQELANDLQFSAYYAGLAMSTDERFKGKLAKTGIYLHLRGTSLDYDLTPLKSGPRKGEPKNTLKKVSEADPSKVIYAHQVKRTRVQIEEHLDTLARAFGALSTGMISRNTSACHQYGNCPYLNLETGGCNVKLPPVPHNPGMAAAIVNLKPLTSLPENFKFDEGEEDD